MPHPSTAHMTIANQIEPLDASFDDIEYWLELGLLAPNRGAAASAPCLIRVRKVGPIPNLTRAGSP
jgi:hypothetical protein